MEPSNGEGTLVLQKKSDYRLISKVEGDSRILQLHHYFVRDHYILYTIDMNKCLNQGFQQKSHKKMINQIHNALRKAQVNPSQGTISLITQSNQKTSITLIKQYVYKKKEERSIIVIYSEEEQLQQRTTNSNSTLLRKWQQPRIGGNHNKFQSQSLAKQRLNNKQHKQITSHYSKPAQQFVFQVISTNQNYEFKGGIINGHLVLQLMVKVRNNCPYYNLIFKPRRIPSQLLPYFQKNWEILAHLKASKQNYSVNFYQGCIYLYVRKVLFRGQPNFQLCLRIHNNRNWSTSKSTDKYHRNHRKTNSYHKQKQQYKKNKKQDKQIEVKEQVQVTKDLVIPQYKNMHYKLGIQFLTGKYLYFKLINYAANPHQYYSVLLADDMIKQKEMKFWCVSLIYKFLMARCFSVTASQGLIKVDDQLIYLKKQAQFSLQHFQSFNTNPSPVKKEQTQAKNIHQRLSIKRQQPNQLNFSKTNKMICKREHMQSLCETRISEEEKNLINSGKQGRKRVKKQQKTHSIKKQRDSKQQGQQNSMEEDLNQKKQKVLPQFLIQRGYQYYEVQYQY